MGTIKEYWHTWLWRDAVTKIITINFVVWLVVACLWLVPPHSSALLRLLTLPGSFASFALVPWSIVTYMFTQSDFLHLMCNMLWLLLFGQIFMQSQSGAHLATLYIFGGIASGASFLLLNTLVPGAYPMMIGSSSAVLAIVGAAAMLFPRWEANLLIFGSVKIIWLAIAAVVFFIVLSPSVDQAIAHGVGFMTGVGYAALKKRGIDITRPVIKLTNGISARSVRKASSYNSNYNSKKYDEQELDRLLDKVNRSGYQSLNVQERQRLFNLSQKIKR